MKIAVRKLRFKGRVTQDLKQQEFRPLDIIDNKIAISRYWLKLNRVYVPKTFVVGTYSPSGFNSPTQPYELRFVMITGEKVTCQFSHKHYDGFQEALKTFRNALPDALVLDNWTVYEWLTEKGTKGRLRQKTAELLATEEDCLALIRFNPVNFLEIMAGKKVNKRKYYKVDDSDLYFQEFGPEAEEN